MTISFKKKHSFDERKKESEKIMTKYTTEYNYCI